MTITDRNKALEALKLEVKTHMFEINKPRKTALALLTAEFWTDARNELGYDEFLTSEGITILEHKAYEDGHSCGFSEIFSKLEDYAEFAKSMIDNSLCTKK